MGIVAKALLLAFAAFVAVRVLMGAGEPSSPTTTAQSISKPAPPPDPFADKSRQRMWIVKAESAVQSKLKDPSSAQFRNVFFNKYVTPNGPVPMVCGEVNSKNSFGGYRGFQRFVASGGGEHAAFEEAVTDFSKLWREVCL